MHSTSPSASATSAHAMGTNATTNGGLLEAEAEVEVEVEVLLLLLPCVRIIVPTTQPGGQPEGQPGGQAATLGHATDDCRTWAKARRPTA